MLSVRLSHPLPSFRIEVEFSVADEILVLFGPSGAGKTTILRHIAGLERAEEGEIRLLGRTLFSSTERTHVPPRERRCGFVFQDLQLFPHLTVLGNVRYGMSRNGPAARPRIERILETFGIGGLALRYPAELSGGERQRVAVARALMAEPDVLLLDEPFSGLDYDSRAVVYDELLEAHRLWRIPFLLVTHERAEAERLGDRVLALREGRFENSGEC